MKKAITIILLALSCIMGYTQTIDPVLLEEIGRCRDNEKIRVFVIMRQQYDQQQLNSRAAHYTTRVERREFVVNELKQFAETSQYDLRHILAEMQRGDLVSEPKVLWIANAIFFEATREAILSLADRSDIMVIGFDEERNWLPDGEESQPANPTRGITSNVTQVNANQVWNLGYTGQGVVVAVIDSGVNYNHLDLVDHLWDGGTEFPHHGYDIYNNDNNPMDDHGHGTHCAGTVCGDGTAGSQTGVAPDATLMCVKCLNSIGRCNDSHVISAMQWAVDHGCDVISMSLGGHGHSGAEKTIIRNACVNVLTSGVIASIAAGNEGNVLSTYPIPDNIGLPGGCPPPYLDPEQEINPGGLSCSVCVGAVDGNDGAASFTSHGPRSWSDSDYDDYPYIVGSQTKFGLIRPDVCAPGVNVISADYTNISGYTTLSGTSMATPCVAGCMALMLSKNNNTTPENLCRILEETAVPLSTGKSNICGYGRVDVLAAINAMNPLLIEAVAVNDTQGNNDGKLNAGETVTLDLTLLNGSDNALDDVTIVLSTESEYVNITNETATLPHFDAGQTQTIENVFGFTLSDGAPGNRAIRFAIEAFMDGESMGYIRFDVMVYGYFLKFDEVIVLNDSNGNGSLDAGETADLHVVISNIGNESAISLVGALSTSFPYLSINDTTGSFGDIEVNGQASANFNVTLANSVPEIYIIDLSLDLVDNNEKHTNLDFELLKGIIVFDDANVKSICVSLWDTNGDGELSYVEAAAVTNLGNAFRENSTISSFDELQYFIGLSSIGSLAFYRCTGLTSIEIPNSVTSIGDRAFAECSGLTSIEIPNSVTSIFYNIDNPFKGCSSLEQIIVEAGNTVYDSRGNCNAIINSSTSKLIAGCKNSVIPNSVTAIGSGAFYGCSGLTSIEIPYSVTEIGWNAFYGCSGLTSIEIPNSVTSIGSYAFEHCSRLASIELSNSVTSIGVGTFYYCYDLTSIEIPNSVTSIGDWAFGECIGLTSMTVWADNPPTIGGDYVFYYVDKFIPIYVPCGSLEAYQNADGWKEFTNKKSMCSGEVEVTVNPSEGGMVTGAGYYNGGDLCVLTATSNPGFSFGNWTENGVAISRDSVFSFHAYPTTIVANFCSHSPIVFADANVKTICVSLWDTNGDGELSYAEAAAVTDLGNAFRNNSSISSFDELQYFIGLTSIGGGTFYRCTSLTSVEIPNSVTSIDGGVLNGAFMFCYGLTSIEIPNSVTFIGQSAFESCTGLTSIELPHSVTSIDPQAFQDCRSLTSIVIPNSVTNIGTNPFTSCYSLEQIIVEEGNMYYDSRGNCNTIINSSTNKLIAGCKNTVIPNSVTSIGVWAFNGCSGLTSIGIPNSVTSIGQGAFSRCSGLTSIAVFPETPPSLGSGVFDNVNKSIPVYVPCDAAEAYQNAGGWNEFTNKKTMCSGEVAVTVYPLEGGTVSGAGYYNGGDLCVLTATPSTGFGFRNWMENGVVVSTDTVFSIYAYPTSFVANFDSLIVFTDANVKAICVTNWDTNGDGELSYAEAAIVTSLRSVFQNNSSILSFDELQYFIGLTTINSFAFYNCNGLTSIKIPNTVTSFGNAAFYNCKGLTSFEIPNSVTSIGEWTFYGCSGLTSIEIPNAVASIGNYLFYGCTGLTSIRIPNTVTSIGDWAFYNCISLTSIEIPNTVTSISSYAFYNCSGLKSMIIWTNNPPTLGNNNVFILVNKSIPVYVPCGALEAYQNAAGWSEFTNIISMCSGEVSVTVNSSEGGTVIGDGYYDGGEICTLTAIANQGYTFINWTVNGVELSNAEVYSFIVTGDVSIVANFDRGVVVIGSGMLINECLPSYSSHYRYTLSQQIYTANEIGRGGTITKIAFFNSGATKTRNYDVYIVSTEKAVFESSNDWITVSEDDLVFSGEVTMSVNNWTTLQLDTPFQYDGISNLTLVVDDNSGNSASWPPMTCRVFETQDNQTICVYNNVTNYAPMNPSYYGTLMNVKNQIIFGFTPTFTKEINAFTNNGGYFLLSFPVGEIAPEEVEHMLDNDYDLYAFDEGKELEWINYKNPDNEFTSLVAGKGYLYANSGNVILSLTSWPYNGNGEITLSKTGDANTAGWNLVGNPFADTAYLDHDFYVMNADGSEIIAAERNYVEPMEGIFVVAENNGEILTFSTTTSNKSPRLVLNLCQGASMNSAIIDRVIIRFDESRTLPKLQIKGNNTKLFIQQDSIDYAVANAGDVGEISVFFKAVENGIYTLSLSNEDVKFSYLHLVDTFTNNDIDLLVTSTDSVVAYTFEAKTTDDVSRFRLVFHVDKDTN